MGDPLLDAVIGGVLSYLLAVLVLLAALRWSVALTHGQREVGARDD